MQLQVIVNKLNKRKSPVIDFTDKSNVVEVVNKDTVFESDNEITNILGTWYKDTNGYYYWGKGVRDVANIGLPITMPLWAFDPTKMSWAHDSIANGGLGIVDLWNTMGIRGETVKVAVIDTGAIYKTNDLNGTINEDLSINCIDFSNIDDTDVPEFHGTKSAGIIAANGKNTNTVYGVAPDCELIIYKLFSNDNLQGYTDQNFCFLLQEARKAKVDIISMSFEMPNKPQGIDIEIQACKDQNILLISSAGDENQILGIKNNYPASLPNCISVGAYRLLNNVKTTYVEHSSMSNFLFCLAPGENVMTTGNTSSSVFHQFTSAAAPFLAGIFALIISYRRKKNLPILVTELTDKLKQSCDRIDISKSWDESEGYGVINPSTLFNFLKK
jgi:major intracellular serine protease